MQAIRDDVLAEVELDQVRAGSDDLGMRDDDAEAVALSALTPLHVVALESDLVDLSLHENGSPVENSRLGGVCRQLEQDLSTCSLDPLPPSNAWNRRP